MHGFSDFLAFTDVSVNLIEGRRENKIFSSPDFSQQQKLEYCNCALLAHKIIASNFCQKYDACYLEYCLSSSTFYG